MEVLIFHDGSTDRTLEIIRQFKVDPRVKIVSKSSRGVSACRNEGVKIAQGEYVIFVDSDDFIDEEMLNKMINAFEIPMPPIEVQKRIVKVLDEMTAVVNELEAELLTELEARKKQYDYYRNKLLTFNEIGGY